MIHPEQLGGVVKMRGTDEASGSLFSYVDLEARIPAGHPLRKIRRVVNEALASLDAAGFVTDLRAACVTPHVAQRSRHSAIDGRTTRHDGYAKSQRHRKRIEEAFGWARTIGGMAQTVCRGLEKVRSRFILTMAANNLARLPRLIAA